MATLVDQAISGVGQVDFGGNRVSYVLVHLDVLGPQVFVDDLNAPDLLLHAGWFSFGSLAAHPGTDLHVFWTERYWINWTDFEWHPIPTVHPNDQPDFCVWASHIRWRLSSGTHGFLRVEGL